MATTTPRQDTLPLHWPMIGLWTGLHIIAVLAVWRAAHHIATQAPGLLGWVGLLALATLGVAGTLNAIGRVIQRRHNKWYTSTVMKAKLRGVVSLTVAVWSIGALTHQDYHIAPGFWAWFAVMGSAFAALCAYTGFGVTVGYHRGFTHRGFKTGRHVTAHLLIGGGMTIEGDALAWIKTHMEHHANADEWDDPHSPYRYAKRTPSGEEYLTWWGLIKGLFWAHLGWMFVHRSPVANPARVPRVMSENRLFKLQKQYYWVLIVASFLIPTLIGAGYGLATGNIWMGALDGLLIPGVLRVMTMLNATFSINSICHVWGGRARDADGQYYMADNGRNIRLLGPITLGESYHSNHHAQPKSAYHGWNWYDLDPSKWLLKLMERTGLATDVVKPNRKLVFGPKQLTPPRLTRPTPEEEAAAAPSDELVG